MRSRTHVFKKQNLLVIACLFVISFYLPGCGNKTEKKAASNPVDYIRPIAGVNDSVSPLVAEKGEVLISYSDCYTCHKADQRSVGPAFKDIAKRYPVNKIYIEVLARKVISGGNRSWGYPVMDPHPNLSMEDAKMMVSYILSMKK